ncbi:hypothetical protein HDU81_001962 [Chytriomyces hyalinus]|nr:hypothetical protein HDU81_001962 [Chytriomyces hyalinus]
MLALAMHSNSSTTTRKEKEALMDTTKIRITLTVDSEGETDVRRGGDDDSQEIDTVTLPLLPPASPFSINTTNSSSLSKASTSRRSSTIHIVPNELLLLVCTRLPTNALLTMRGVTRRLGALASLVLRDRMRISVDSIAQMLSTLEQQHSLVEEEKRPHLRHYKQFVRNISMNDITEAIWYATPPEELKTVCECLCILKGSMSSLQVSPRRSFLHPTDVSHSSASTYPHNNQDNTDSIESSLRTLSLIAPSAESATQSFAPSPPSSLSNSGTTLQQHMQQQQLQQQQPTPPAAMQLLYTEDPSVGVPQTWASIKKNMSRYEFKNWVLNLRSNVDKIPYAAVKRVEYMIMHDQSITYERLREVSRPGYSLLIVVAACLQYGNISEEVKAKSREVAACEEQLRKGRLFLASVEGL